MFIFAVFAFIMTGQLADRKQSGTGSGKVREAGLETQVARNETALYVGTLPTRLSVQTQMKILLMKPVRFLSLQSPCNQKL